LSLFQFFGEKGGGHTFFSVFSPQGA
jgi:hypothetical protein